jgi:hypothetical protein
MKKSRRYFLIEGGLAATAMFALRPFTGFAGAASPFTGLSNSCGRKLCFLHTGNINPVNDHPAIQYVTNIRNSNAHAILLKAGQINQDETARLVYDASINGSNDRSEITGDYKIITKGNIKTGVISAKPGDSDVVQKINHLSAYLKKEKNCTVVVCLSQLGYKNKNTPDDITLAKQSTHLDIIIGGHADNFHKHPVISLNNNNAEVIIHAAAGDPTAIGNIEIDFDEKGRKSYISFTNQSSKNTTLSKVMPAA